MGTRIVKPPMAIFVVPIFLCVALVSLGMGGCASTAPNTAITGPGTPDETQMQHYEMLKSAIEVKSKNDALAALALLQSDVSRWHTNVLTVANAMTDMAALTDAVDKEDWPLAHKLFMALTSKYRHTQ